MSSNPDQTRTSEPDSAGAALRTFSRGNQIGLRGRIALAVTVVSMVMSLALAVTTVTVGRNTLINTRENGVTEQAMANAETIRGGLTNAEPATLQTLLSSLPDTGSPSMIINSTRAGLSAEPTTVSINPRYGIDKLPKAFLKQVTLDRQSSIMRFTAQGEPLLGVGIAIPDSNASYFQIHTLTDINAALRIMRIALIVVTVAATIISMLLGFWTSRYALKPLKRVGAAAEAVALGQLDTRINYEDYEKDVDLAPLVANFNEMVSALEDRINRDARFASDVSHELRSPLTTLNASIEVLTNNRDVLPERSQRALDLLTLDMERFTQLVEDLLEISRFDAGAVRLELDAVAIVPTVQKAIGMVSNRSIPVEVDDEVQDLVLACDKRRLVRILANFVDNAAKYADGATGVFVDVVAPSRNSDDLETVQISVEDSGAGVPENERKGIFDRFNRGDQGGSRGVDGGVGLGLALAAEHARLQGGRVWVEDRHDGGPGARFVVELPLVVPVDVDGDDGLAEISPSEAEAFALTGVLPTIGAPSEDGDDQ